MESYKIFDMIGDIGGFLEGLLLLFSLFASPISAKFYEYTLAENSYKRINSEFQSKKGKKNNKMSKQK